MELAELESKSVEELQDIAKGLDIPDIKGLRKQELTQKIMQQNPDEDLLTIARREFEEETSLVPAEPFTSLGSIKLKSGKTVHAWAWEGDADPARIVSNETRTEWPRGSGHWMTFPEIDRCAWFDPDTARIKLNAAQAELVTRLEAAREASRVAR